MAVFSTDPLLRLLFGVDRQHAENKRCGQLKVQLCYTIRYRFAYIVEMRGIAFDHTAEGDKSRRFRAGCSFPELLYREADLHRAGHCKHNDRFDLMLVEHTYTASFKLVDDCRIPLRFHQNDTGILHGENACICM